MDLCFLGTGEKGLGNEVEEENNVVLLFHLNDGVSSLSMSVQLKL